MIKEHAGNAIDFTTARILKSQKFTCMYLVVTIINGY